MPPTKSTASPPSDAPSLVIREDHGRQTREDWTSSGMTLSKGEARRVDIGNAKPFNRSRECRVEETTNNGD